MGRALHSKDLIQLPADEGFPGGSDGKESACNMGDLGSIPGSGRAPLRKEWQPILLFFPGESHGQRSLVGYSPWGCKESDTTEATQHARMHIYIICRISTQASNMNFYSDKIHV